MTYRRELYTYHFELYLTFNPLLIYYKCIYTFKFLI
nr:MAG TPA: hypothetical protein [Caudoviricetes sp.]